MSALSDWIYAVFVISTISSVALINASTNEIVGVLNDENSGSNEQYERSSGIDNVDRTELLPPTIDWRNCTPHVRDQGLCDASYAFSAIGAVECAMWRSTRNHYQLSVQNIIDCGPVHSRGCKGGNVVDALKYVIDVGVFDEEIHPYLGVENNCSNKQTYCGKGKAFLVSTKSADEEELKAAVARLGAIPTVIYVNNNFLTYSGGIFHDINCSNSTSRYNHTVLTVGYGTDNGQEYWTIKNSWGTAWGEGGYMRMARNANNMCGIASQLIPILVLEDLH